MRKSFALIFLIGITLSCDSLRKIDGPRLNIFPLEQDKRLGLQVKQEIAKNPQEYNLLPRNSHPEAYSHLDRIMTKVLNSGKVKYRNDFEWEAYIIHDDNTLNAFCTPGGYIYVYTGLIKYLENESDLAGVIGHEIAHADRRHSTTQLTKLYGVEILAAVALGENSGTTIAQVAKSLVSLKFSRGHESDADEYSVIYLCPTDYHADGAASFFEKLTNENAASPPEFLSTHPNPGNRVKDIRAKEKELNCGANQDFSTRYARFKQSLPK